MLTSSIGDLAHSFSLQRRNAELKQHLQQLTQEVASGQVSDVKDVLAGNFSYLAELDYSLEALEGYDIATAEAQLFASSMQSALDRVYDFNDALASDLIFAGNLALGVAAGNPSVEARETARAMIDSLNVSVAGRSLFAGNATDRPPLAELDDLLDGVRSAVSGATTAADMMTAVEAWAADASGFSAAMYEGSATALSAFRLSAQDSVPLDVKADEPVFARLLAYTGLAAVAGDGALGLSDGEQSELQGLVGQALLNAQTDLIEVRSKVGFAEGRMDEIEVRNAAQSTSLTYAKQELLSVDPFESATRLEEVQFQLQSLYAITARSSQLSLVNFL